MTKEKMSSEDQFFADDRPESETSSANDKEDSFLEMIKKTEQKAEEQGRRSHSDRASLVKNLYLSRCKKFGVVPAGLVVRNCSKSVLNLKNHTLGPRGAMTLAAPLKISTTIEELELSGCDIQESGFKSLQEALTDNVYVEKLGLSQNNLGVKGAEYLSHILCYNTTITTVTVAGNHFGDKAAVHLSTIIQRNSVLKSFDISNNELSKDTAKLLGPALGANETLITLNLSWNMFRLRDIIPLAQGLKDNVRLKVLDLSYNGVGYEGARVLGEALKENSTLLELDLTGANLVDKAAFALAQGLEVNESVTKLRISHNPITHNGACCFMTSLLHNENLALQELYLEGVTVDSEFSAMVRQIQTKQPQFKAFYEGLPLVKQAPALSRLYKCMLRSGRDPSAVFDLSYDSADKVLTTEQFCQYIKNANIPLDEEDINFLLAYLSQGNKGNINLSLVFDRWSQYSMDYQHMRSPRCSTPTHEDTAG